MLALMIILAVAVLGVWVAWTVREVHRDNLPEWTIPPTFALMAMVVVLAAFALASCSGPLRYENQNGPRGPESFEVPALEWPTFGAACCPEKDG